MSVFHFRKYRPFLRDSLANFPKQGRGQTLKLAQHLGVNSSFVSQVMSGQKDFNLEQAQAVSEFLGLQSMDTDYFLIMVQHERAGTQKLRKYFEQKMNTMQAEAQKVVNRIEVDRSLSEAEKTKFYSSWVYPAIPLYCSVGKGKSFEEILKWTEWPRDRVLETVEFLLSSGFLQNKDGIYIEGIQRTHIEQGSPHLLRHHTNWRMKSLLRSETLTPQELMFTAPFSASKSDIEWLREELVQFIQRFTKKLGDSKPDSVGCLNLDLISVR